MNSKNKLWKIEIKNFLETENKNYKPEIFFIEKLNYYYSIYKTQLDLEKEKWEKKVPKNVYLEPEKLSIESPLTILHGVWGSGKTFFIEEKLAKEWDNLIRCKDNEFKNLIIINLWNHFYGSTDTILEFAKLLMDKISKILKNDKKTIFENIFKLLIKEFWTSFSFLKLDKMFNFIKKFKSSLTINIDELLLDEKFNAKEIKEKMKDIFKQLEPTIIVLDNLERLEDSVQTDIIKIIRFYSFLPNLLFVLPVDKNHINFGKFKNNSESAIEKYITLNVWFEFQQDYSKILEKYKLSKGYFSQLNNILNKSNDEYTLTIRELEYVLLKNNFNDETKINLLNKNKYLCFLLFNELIWKNEILENDLEVFTGLIKTHCANNNINEINEKLLKSKEFKNYINNAKISEKQQNKTVSFDYFEDIIELIIEIINNEKNKLENDNDLYSILLIWIKKIIKSKLMTKWKELN